MTDTELLEELFVNPKGPFYLDSDYTWHWGYVEGYSPFPKREIDFRKAIERFIKEGPAKE
jgi:hypothetical protein